MHLSENMPASAWSPLCLVDTWNELNDWQIKPIYEGLSDAAVFRVSKKAELSRYLKIAQNDAAAALRDEVLRTNWLAKHGVRVPALLRVEDQRSGIAMMTEAAPGTSADSSPLPTQKLIAFLANGIGALHALSTADCPFDETISKRLTRAASAIGENKIDAAEFSHHNKEKEPLNLLRQLEQEQPAEDIVVIHGDATLSNVFVDDNGAVTFIDCGNAGRGDRYQDLAILAADIHENYGAEMALQFVRDYGTRPWDRQKADFFSDLYEFF